MKPPLSLAESLQRVDESDREQLQRDLLDVIEQGGIVDREVRVTAGDGIVRWLYVRGQRERPAPDSPLVGMCLDVTSTRAAIARNAELAERLRLATEAAGVGIWDFDLRLGRGFWTEQMYALYGVPIDEAPYDFEQLLAHVHPRDQARMAAAAHRLFVEGVPFEREICIVRRDGSTRDVVCVGIALRDAHGNVARVLGTNIDVSELRQAERKAGAALERLEIATRSARLGVSDWTPGAGTVGVEFDDQMCALYGLAPANTLDAPAMARLSATRRIARALRSSGAACRTTSTKRASNFVSFGRTDRCATSSRTRGRCVTPMVAWCACCAPTRT